MSNSPVSLDPTLTLDLLQTMLNTNNKIQDIQSYLFALEHFVPSDLFLQFAFDYFHEHVVDQIAQFHFINFLKKWIQIDRELFRNQAFENFRLSLSGSLPQVLKTAMEDDEDDDNSTTEEENYPAIESKVSNSAPTNKTFLLNYNPIEIARQLTLIDFDNLSAINYKELLHCKWSKEGQSPKLNKNSQRANTLANWIAYQYVQHRHANRKFRVQLLSHILLICRELLQLRNFHSLLAIYLGFNLFSMKDALDLINEPSFPKREIWEEISNLFNFDGNYANYREKIKSMVPPLIPCQEIFLKDLLFYDESVPNLVDGKVNYTKLKDFGNYILFFRNCQKSHYLFHHYAELYDLLEHIEEVKVLDSSSSKGLSSSEKNTASKESSRSREESRTREESTRTTATTTSSTSTGTVSAKSSKKKTRIQGTDESEDRMSLVMSGPVGPSGIIPEGDIVEQKIANVSYIHTSDSDKLEILQSREIEKINILLEGMNRFVDGDEAEYVFEAFLKKEGLYQNLALFHAIHNWQSLPPPERKEKGKVIKQKFLDGNSEIQIPSEFLDGLSENVGSGNIIIFDNIFIFVMEKFIHEIFPKFERSTEYQNFESKYLTKAKKKSIVSTTIDIIKGGGHMVMFDIKVEISSILCEIGDIQKWVEKHLNFNTVDNMISHLDKIVQLTYNLKDVAFFIIDTPLPVRTISKPRVQKEDRQYVLDTLSFCQSVMTKIESVVKHKRENSVFEQTYSNLKHIRTLLQKVSDVFVLDW